jgi:hypothetical protein
MTLPTHLTHLTHLEALCDDVEIVRGHLTYNNDNSMDHIRYLRSILEATEANFHQEITAQTVKLILAVCRAADSLRIKGAIFGPFEKRLEDGFMTLDEALTNLEKAIGK